MQIDIIITVILFVVALLRPQSKGVAVLIFALMWSLWGGILGMEIMRHMQKYL